jgi:hypothetical protein
MGSEHVYETKPGYNQQDYTHMIRIVFPVTDRKRIDEWLVPSAEDARFEVNR